MKLEEILEEQAKKNKIDELSLNADGICYLMVDGLYLIAFEKSNDDEGFFIYASVAVLTPTNEQEFSRIALEANLFFKETGHANFGYASQLRTLVLFEYFEENNLDLSSYNKKFDEFISYVSHWMHHFQEILPSDDSSNLKQHVNKLINDHHMKIFFA